MLSYRSSVSICVRTMKITKLRIQNFRCFRDQTVDFGDYTCLVGPGGVGKSTVLTALRIFFRDTSGSPTDLINLQNEDFHQRDTSNDIVITVTFSDLEAEAQEDFAHYFRQDQLIISAVAHWDETLRRAEVKQFGQRLVIRAFGAFFRAEADEASVADLKTTYAEIRKTYPTLPAPTTKGAMQEALHEYENGHRDECELTLAQDEFYGFTKGTKRLQKYLQWVFVPAVKDASTEQLEAKRTALGRLLERTVRSKMSFAEPIASMHAEIEGKYQKLLDENQGILAELSESLTTRIRDWAHPDASLTLAWRSDPGANISISEPHAEVSAGEGRFEGTLARFGHGLQRSFLLALLQELSGCRDTGGPKLLLACEEPELYQHPPQVRYLASLLQRLSDSNSQVMVSTHSPYFISGTGFRDVRVIRHEIGEDQPLIRRATLEELSAKLTEAVGEKPVIPSGVEFKIEQALQPGLNEMFFSEVLIFVEGPEDFGFISAYFALTDRGEEYRRLGCHIVLTSGKGRMIEPLAIAKILGIPTFVIFDADRDDEKDGHRRMHERDNLALMRLCSIQSPKPFPTAIFETTDLVVWPTKIADVIRNEFGQVEWERFEHAVRDKRGILEVPDLKKNALFIGLVLAKAYEDGKRSAVLDGLCNRILAYARSVRSRPCQGLRAQNATEASPMAGANHEPPSQ